MSYSSGKRPSEMTPDELIERAGHFLNRFEEKEQNITTKKFEEKQRNKQTSIAYSSLALAKLFSAVDINEP